MTVMTASDRLTALEVLNRTGGKTEDARRIIEIMRETNEILYDAPTTEANDGTVNTTLVRTALPKAEHRIYNNGVGESASQTDLSHDYSCEVAAWSKIDEMLVRNSSNPQELLMTESQSFIEGMGLEQATDIIYGNHAADEAYMNGLAVRRSKTDGEYCIDMGGASSKSGALTSLYLIKWGLDKIHMFYPRGAKGIGVERFDHGIERIEGENGKDMRAFVNYFRAQYGLSVRNEKSVIRFCNIDLDTINAETLIYALIRNRTKLPQGSGTISIVAGADVLAMMDEAAAKKGNVCYTATDPFGKQLTMIRDMRFRQMDAILTTEDYVPQAA